MNQKETLTPYVTSQLQAGIAADTIKQRLIQQGWGSDIVDEVVAEATGAAPTPSQVVSTTPAASQTQAQPQPQAAAGPYSVRQAFSDALNAIRNNTIGIGAMVLIGMAATAITYVLIFAVAAVSVVGSIFTAAAFNSRGAGIMQLVITLVVLGIVAISVLALVSAFSTNIIALAVNDGADNKESNIKQTLTAGLKRTLRVTLAALLSSLIIVAPILIASILGLLIMVLVPKLVVLVFLLGAVAIAATLILALRLVLVSIIALFEPSLPITGIFGRAKHLMGNGGSWFILKCILVIAVINIVISVLTPHSSETMNGARIMSSLLGTLITAFISLLFSAVLVMFYRHQKATRG